MRGYVNVLGRVQKAKKISAVIEDYIGVKTVNLKILDIGVGNGEIAQYLAEIGNEVYGVDLQDILNIKNRLFHFTQVVDECLPFKDDYFDIVISNHVVEHTSNPKLHIKEIKRVMRGGGICYFATPNRYFPYEVHTHTLFLHYFPNKIFFYFLKVLKRYKEPIHLLGYKTMKKMFKKEGFIYKDYTTEIINNPNKYYIRDYGIKIPVFLSILSKTNIWILKKSE